MPKFENENNNDRSNEIIASWLGWVTEAQKSYLLSCANNENYFKSSYIVIIRKRIFIEINTCMEF